jgi:poly-beta-1,6-N-acetyl-D-glucosamine synthase
MSHRLSYVAITAARNEAENLPRIASCLCAQTALPLRWLIIDNGSTDDTAAVAESLARTNDWIRVVRTAGTAHPVRGGAVVRAFHAGLDALDVSPDVVVKLDADVSMAPAYFERLLAAFGSDPKLGMASGAELVEEDGVWTMRHQARASVVWGPARAYRLSCLLDVLPLEERMGWDAIDEFKANVRGWRTGTLHGLEYRHHRLEGERDGARLRFWATEGSAAFFMGYRPSYLVCRSLFRALREPTALAMLTGYVGAAIRREDRLSDQSAVEYLRSQQRLRTLWLRSREVRGA